MTAMKNIKPHPASMKALSVAMMISLTGCTSLSQSAPQQSKTTDKAPVTSAELALRAPSAPAVSDDLRIISRIGKLPAQPLLQKGCGLFLWASLPERTLVFYTDSEKETALMTLDNRQTSLHRENVSGLTYAGLAGDQTFAGPDLNVKLSFTAEQTKGFTNGAIVRQATLRLRDQKGWEVIMPVAGLIGCNSE